MKKTFISVLLVLLSLSCAFAAWDVTRTEGNLWRPDGEILLYSLVQGTYSDSSVKDAPSNVCLNVELANGADYPYVVWRFEVHKGDWTNRLLEYGEKAKATISVIDESGAVTIFNTRNESYGTYWNVLSAESGRSFTKLLIANKTLDIEITVEGDTYSFSVDNTGFNDLMRGYYDSMLPEPKTGEWVYDAVDQSNMEELRDLKSIFGSLSDFPLGTYRLEDTVISGGEEYTITIEMDSDGMAKNKFPRVDIDLVHVLHDDFFRYNEWLSDEDKLSSFIFVIDGVSYRMKNRNPIGVWALSEDGQKVVNAMKSAKSCVIKFTFKGAGVITYEFDGKKFAEIYEAAKTIPCVE